MYAKGEPIQHVTFEPENVPKHVRAVAKNGIIYEWRESIFYSSTNHKWLSCRGKRKNYYR